MNQDLNQGPRIRGLDQESPQEGRPNSHWAPNYWAPKLVLCTELNTEQPWPCLILSTCRWGIIVPISQTSKPILREVTCLCSRAPRCQGKETTFELKSMKPQILWFQFPHLFPLSVRSPISLILLKVVWAKFSHKSEHISDNNIEPECECFMSDPGLSYLNFRNGTGRLRWAGARLPGFTLPIN